MEDVSLMKERWLGMLYQNLYRILFPEFIYYVAMKILMLPINLLLDLIHDFFMVQLLPFEHSNVKKQFCKIHNILHRNIY